MTRPVLLRVLLRIPHGVLLCALLAGAAAGRAAPPEGPARLAMFVLKPTGVEEPLAGALLDAMAAELSQTGALEVLTPADVQRLTDFAAGRAEAGCDESNAACLAELGNALGVPYLLSTSVVKIDGAFVASHTLLAVDEARTVGRETAAPRDGTVAAFLDEVRRSVLRLMGPFLKSASGTLVVGSSEEGADVRLDGRLVGVTPLETLVTAGKHEVAVGKDGFVEARKDVVMPPEGRLTVTATLAPSEETAEAWSSRAWGTRLGGVAALAAGALAGAGAGALFYANAARADELKRDAGGVIGGAEQQVFLARDVGAFTLTGVAVVGLGGGALLWLVSGDPDRYVGLVGDAGRIVVRGEQAAAP